MNIRNYPLMGAILLVAGAGLTACEPAEEEQPLEPEIGAEEGVNGGEGAYNQEGSFDDGTMDGQAFQDDTTRPGTLGARTGDMMPQAGGPRIESAVAVLHPTEGNELTGTVHFLTAQTGQGVQVHAVVNGMSEGRHAFHVHKFGDCSAPDASSAGKHFAFRAGARTSGAMDMDGMDDTGAMQGMEDMQPPGDDEPTTGMEQPGMPGATAQANRILGNLGEFNANPEGKATVNVIVSQASLNGARSILGRSVVVHAKGNDPSQPPDGAAGARIACGVIGVMKPGSISVPAPTGEQTPGGMGMADDETP